MEGMSPCIESLSNHQLNQLHQLFQSNISYTKYILLGITERSYHTSLRHYSGKTYHNHWDTICSWVNHNYNHKSTICHQKAGQHSHPAQAHHQTGPYLHYLQSHNHIEWRSENDVDAISRVEQEESRIPTRVRYDTLPRLQLGRIRRRRQRI